MANLIVSGTNKNVILYKDGDSETRIVTAHIVDYRGKKNNVVEITTDKDTFNLKMDSKSDCQDVIDLLDGIF